MIQQQAFFCSLCTRKMAKRYVSPDQANHNVSVSSILNYLTHIFVRRQIFAKNWKLILRGRMWTFNGILAITVKFTSLHSTPPSHWGQHWVSGDKWMYLPAARPGKFPCSPDTATPGPSLALIFYPKLSNLTNSRLDNLLISPRPPATMLTQIILCQCQLISRHSSNIFYLKILRIDILSEEMLDTSSNFYIERKQIFCLLFLDGAHLCEPFEYQFKG